MSASRRSRRLLAALLVFACACATGALTVEEERQLGAEVEQQARQKFRFVRDEVVVDYVSDLGADLLRVMGPQPFEYDFYVVEDDELNAFAVPGGHVYVHTGLILKARNVGELIGVMGHEVGHVYHRHVAQNYNRQRNTGIARQLGVLAAGMLAGGAAAQAAESVDRRQRHGLPEHVQPRRRARGRLLRGGVCPAGYDPDGLPSFFATMLQQYGDGGAPFLSSHPPRRSASRTRGP